MAKGWVKRSGILFKDKIKNLNRCNIKLGGNSNRPFIHSSDINRTHVDGIEIKMLTIFAEKYNFTIMSEIDEERDIIKWLIELREENFDIIAGGIPLMHFDSDLDIQSTIGYTTHELMWFVPRADPKARWRTIFSIYLHETTAISIGIFVLIGLLMKYWAKLQFLKENTYFHQVSKNIFLLFGGICSISFPQLPTSCPLRLILLSAFVFTFFMNASYQMLLFDYIIQPGYEHQIQELGEITSTYKFCYTPRMNSLINNINGAMKFPVKLKMYSRETVRECVLDIAQSKKSVMYAERFAVQVEMQNLHNAELIYEVKSSLTLTYFISAYVSRNNWMLPYYNQFIFLLIEGGFINKWLMNTGHNKQPPAIEYMPLNMAHFQGVFYLYLVLLAISIIIFIAEHICYHKMRKISNCKEKHSHPFIPFNL